MKYLMITLVLSTAVLTGCPRGGDQKTPSIPPPTPGNPNPVVNCREFNDFMVDYGAMKAKAGMLDEISETADRVAIASALLASHLANQYAMAMAMGARGRDATQAFLKYFNWIFEGDGRVRTIPNHPLTSHCYRR